MVAAIFCLEAENGGKVITETPEATIKQEDEDGSTATTDATVKQEDEHEDSTRRTTVSQAGNHRK